MNLSSDLLNSFAKVATSKNNVKMESTVNGTAVEYNGKMYVKLDGSDLLTPVNTTTDMNDGERVTVSIKNHTATVTGNMSSPSARTDTVKEMGTQISEFEIVIADKVSVYELDAERGRIDDLVSDNVTIKETLTANEAIIAELEAENATITGKLTANEAEIEALKTTKLDAEIADITYATIDNLSVTNAKVNNLEATYGDFEVLTTNKFNAIEADISNLNVNKLNAETAKITYATITDLNAAKADIGTLNADVADINTLIFGSASGDVIQTSFANAVIAQLGNAQIKSAMIESLSASKITAGDIITNNVRVLSEDGKLLISDETIHISDETRVRVQIGKDAAGDYSINVWDADGNLMFSEGGITDSAIKEAIIRNDMVSDNANISAHKLDIDSLFTVINEDGSHTIKSSQIYLSDENQTLDVAFQEMTTSVDGIQATVNSQGTELEVIQGQISSKIWQQDITTAVNGIEIGATNLAEKTYSDWRDTNVSQWSGGIGYQVNGIDRLGKLTAFEELGLKVGDPCTISVDLNAINKSIKLRVDLHKGSTIGENYVGQYTETVTIGTNKRVSYTTIVTEEFPYFALYVANHDTANAATTTEQYKCLKIEKGTIPTDWSPAPDDLENEVSTLSTKYSSLEQTVDGISATVSSHTTELSDLGTRVSSSETKINQNAGNITAMATRVSNNETAIASLELTADGLTSRVTANEGDIETALTNAANAQTDIDNLTVGGRNILLNSSFKYDADRWFGDPDSLNIEEKDGKMCGHFNSAATGNTYYLTQSVFGKLETNTEYTMSGWVKTENIVQGVTNFCIMFCHDGQYNNNGTSTWYGYGQRGFNINGSTGAWQYLTWTFKTDTTKLTNATSSKIYVYTRDYTGDVYFYNLKLEKGNRATDWTPALEDMATTDMIDNTNEQITATNDRVTTAETLMQQLSDCISTLVTDSNGESLMTQTSTGWTFSMKSVNDTMNSLSSSIENLQNATGSTQATVSTLQNAVNDLEETAEYVRVITYESEPCIELGESGSEFKLMITNTRIMFMKGSSVPTYIDTTGLVTENITINGELHHGNWVWKQRSNGNYGLQYIG